MPDRVGRHRGISVPSSAPWPPDRPKKPKPPGAAKSTPPERRRPGRAGP